MSCNCFNSNEEKCSKLSDHFIKIDKNITCITETMITTIKKCPLNTALRILQDWDHPEVKRCFHWYRFAIFLFSLVWVILIGKTSFVWTRSNQYLLFHWQMWDERGEAFEQEEILSLKITISIPYSWLTQCPSYFTRKLINWMPRTINNNQVASIWEQQKI